MAERHQTFFWSNRAFKPMGAIGAFFAMSLDTLVAIPRRPFALAGVLGAVVVRRASIAVADADAGDPLHQCIVVFTFNVLFSRFGAADLSGAGAAFGTVTQIGPIVTVLVVAGAGATAMCADLGARTIREELDAMRVMGINPIQALVVPTGAGRRHLLPDALVGSDAGRVWLARSCFSVFVQHVTPGAFVGELDAGHRPWRPRSSHCSSRAVRTVGRPDRLLQGHHRWAVGQQGVGNAVNETVIYSFVALFFINVV